MGDIYIAIFLILDFMRKLVIFNLGLMGHFYIFEFIYLWVYFLYFPFWILWVIYMFTILDCMSNL